MSNSKPPHFLRKLLYRLRLLVSSRFREIVRTPIFVVGCGHSGTTLLLRVLGSHPRIHPILEETYVFLRGGKSLLRSFDEQAHAKGARRWVEKTPGHIRCLEQIFATRPNARVLLMLRDGRDVAVSIRKRKGDLLSGARRWVEDNRAGEKWWSDPRVRVVRYENLVANFETEMAEIFAFLGEDYTEEVRSFHTKFGEPSASKPEDSSEKNHVAYRTWQVSQPLFDGSGRWRTDLDAAERELVKREAGEMLREYGYTTSDDW